MLEDANQRLMAHNAKLRAEIDAMNAGRGGQRVAQGRLYDELARAFAEGEPETVRRLLAAGVNVNALMTYVLEDGDFAETRTEPVLIAAARYNNPEILRVILDKNPDVNVRGQDGDTVLRAFQASSQEGYDVIRRLIQKGADVNASDAGARSVLQMAEGDDELAAILRAAGAKKNPMENADARAADAYGNTALMFAVRDGSLEEVKRQIAAGADVNAANKGGNMPLLLAIETGREWGKQNKNAPIIKALLDAGANANVADSQGETALIKATPDTKVMKMLLDKGVNVNAAQTSASLVTGRLGYTALMQSAIYCDAKAVKMLIAAGADLNARDEDGKTAWDYASQGTAMYSERDDNGCNGQGGMKDAKAVLNMLKASGKKAASKKKR